MVSTFFALFYTAGAWRAWRKNPMYSARLTLRLVAVIVFGVGAFFAAVIGVTELTEHGSKLIAGAAIGGVCFVGGLALIWLILQFSFPATPPLPASAKLTNVNRAKLIAWAQRFGWLLLGLTVAAVALPGKTKFVVYAVGGVAVLLSIFMLFAAYFVALHLDRSLTSVEADPWVHWHYAPGQWSAWSDVEVARIEATGPQWVWHRDWKALLIVFVTVSIPFAVNFNPADWYGLAAMAALSWLMVLGLVVGVDRYAKTAPYRLRKLLANAAPDTYFGAGGIFSDGVYTQWQTIANYLRTAAVDERDPRSLTFVFERSVSGGGTIEVRQNVLIPAGAEADLTRLQSALSLACPTARVALT